MSPPQRLIEERLAQIHDDPAVCEALSEVGATHLYQDSARRDEGAKVNERTEGMWEVDVSTGFTEVDAADDAAVYRIEVCEDASTT